MKKKRWAALCMAALVLLTAGCGGSAKNMAGGVTSESSAAMDTAASMPEVAEAVAEETGDGGITSQNGIDPVAQTGRKLIRTVRLELQTKEFDAVIEGLVKKVQEMDGYIENSSMWGNNYYNNSTRNSEYTVRVPADRLDEFIQVVGELGNVTYKSENVEDVTLQYVDVESHKKALETEQERLLELLGQAENLEDLLAIESRLSEVRYELENYGSQKRYLDNQIDYSTVNLSISEVERITETGRKTFFQEVAERFGNSLYAVGSGLRGFVIVLLGSLPVLVFWAAVIAVFLLIVRRLFYRKKGKTAKEKKRFWKKKESGEEEKKDDTP